MEATFKNEGEIAIVVLSGPLDIERTQPFKKNCEKFLVGKKVIFNMEKVTFVGSSGIQSFIEAVKVISESSDLGIHLVGTKTEFKRIFSQLDIKGLQFHEKEKMAIDWLQPELSLVVNF